MQRTSLRYRTLARRRWLTLGPTQNIHYTKNMTWMKCSQQDRRSRSPIRHNQNLSTPTPGRGFQRGPTSLLHQLFLMMIPYGSSPKDPLRSPILVLFVHLFDLRLFGFVCFLFLLVSGKGCGLWLWNSLDFSLTFFSTTKNITKTLRNASRKLNHVGKASTGTTSWTVSARAEKLHAFRRFLLPTHDATITGHKGLSFGILYELSYMVARLSKCEITLCMGNTHVLKLLFWPTASEFWNLQSRPLACGPLARFLCAWIMRRGRFKPGSWYK